MEERQKVLRLLVKEILVNHDTITTKHSIPVTGRGTPPPGTSGGTDTPGYLMRSGRHDAPMYQRPSVVPTMELPSGNAEALRRENEAVEE